MILDNVDIEDEEYISLFGWTLSPQFPAKNEERVAGGELAGCGTKA